MSTLSALLYTKYAAPYMLAVSRTVQACTAKLQTTMHVSQSHACLRLKKEGKKKDCGAFYKHTRARHKILLLNNICINFAKLGQDALSRTQG